MKHFFKTLCSWLFKTSKILAVAAIILVALAYGGWKFLLWRLEHQPMYLSTPDKQHRIRIPDEVRDSKDCQKLKSWVLSNLPPTFANAPCPWQKIGKIARFTMHGTTFEIPREYLLSKNELDGEVDSFTVLLNYPDMGPLPKNKKQNWDKIHVFVKREDNPKKEMCYTDGCVDNNLALYLTWANLIDLKLQGDKYVGTRKKTIIKKIDTDKNSRLDYYKLDSNSDHFIKGNPWNPEFWIRCGKEGRYATPSCEHRWMLNDGIEVNYSYFRREHLKDAEDIHQKVIEKLESLLLNYKL